jgi:NADPH-dependent curcumin reductase CurA
VILDTMLRMMNFKSRITVCGLISEYNSAEPYGVKMFRSILVNRIKMQGMIVFDWLERYPEANRDLIDMVVAGKLKTRESVVDGIENAPKGFIGLLKGENFGKQLVRLA